MSKAGSKWTTEEENQLLDEIKTGKSFNELALLHNRNVGGIVSRLKTIAASMVIKEGADIEELVKMFHIDKEYIEKEVKYITNRNEKKTSSISKTKGYNENNDDPTIDSASNVIVNNNVNSIVDSNKWQENIRRRLDILEQKLDNVLEELANITKILV